ncbi:MAG: PEP-CTERM sorting domain-containing protein [Fimbriimonadaceae bacterium]|jgi:hypothetical protein|nr:PEP-CTERM sorting domain-containing protein [Fimbriimonadaceae bacterium]
MNRNLAATLLLSLMAGISQANLLFNGDLDRVYNQEIVPGFFLPKPDQWVNVGTRAVTGPYEDELSSEPWAGPSPTPVTSNGFNVTTGAVIDPDMAVFFKSFTGNATNGAATGHLYQDVAGTAGLIYTLTGWAGAEANYMAADSVFALEFLNGSGSVIGSSILSLTPTLQTPNNLAFNYKLYTVTGTAPTGTATVRARISMIDGMANPAGGGQAFVVDDFTLTAVPEPMTMAALGLGALVIARRRRMKK